VVDFSGPSPVQHPARPTIKAKDIAWCARVTRARRERWASAGRLKADPPFTEHDAVETAIAFSLARQGVSQKQASIAWGMIQAQIQSLLIAGERDIWIVVSAEGPRAWALPGGDAAASQAALDGRCWIVNTRESAEEARVRYAELAARYGAADGVVAQLPRRNDSVRGRRKTTTGN